MIKIRPYYDRSEKESAELLELYLNIVADVTPFLSKDVLDGIPAAEDTKSDTPRQRKNNASYVALLKKHLTPSELEKLSELEQDALLARRLIMGYSEDLHDFIYEGVTELDDCRANRDNLRELLTLKLTHGKLPEGRDYRLPEDVARAKEAEEVKKTGKTKNKTQKKSEEEKQAEAERKEKKALLMEHVFRYDQFSSHKKIYEYLQKLNIGVCPYCNRQYTTTASSETRRTRPQLDHFKNKSDYPFLALSINNLIPCCGVCNLMKHDDDSAMLYPYDESMGDLYVFETRDKEGKYTSLRTGATRAPEDFDLLLSPRGNPQDEAMKRAAGTKKNLALEQLYQSHKAYITNLYYQRYVHTDLFYDDTIWQFRDLFELNPGQPTDSPEAKAALEKQIAEARESLKRALFLMDYRREAWADRPLTKLTHDISEEIDKLYESPGAVEA